MVMQYRRVVRGSRDESYRRFETRRGSPEAALLGNAQGFHAELVDVDLSEAATRSYAMAHDFEPIPVKTKMLAGVVG